MRTCFFFDSNSTSECLWKISLENRKRTRVFACPSNTRVHSTDRQRIENFYLTCYNTLGFFLLLEFSRSIEASNIAPYIDIKLKIAQLLVFKKKKKIQRQKKFIAKNVSSDRSMSRQQRIERHEIGSNYKSVMVAYCDFMWIHFVHDIQRY